MRLGQADPERGLRDAPGRLFAGRGDGRREVVPEASVSDAAKALSRDWAETGHHKSWRSIRSRYYVLRAAMKPIDAGRQLYYEMRAKEIDDLH